LKTHDAYKRDLTVQLNEWNARINLAQVKLSAAKVENTGAVERLIYARELDVLHAKQLEAAKKIKELELADSDPWKIVKVTTDKVWDDLRASLAQAISKFK
jgi:hypothetical protein